jgi:ATP synthase mitochondrial F1 complex assembly factor 2
VSFSVTRILDQPHSSLFDSFYESEAFPQLDKLQKEHWDPLLSWARETFGIDIQVFDSVLSAPQPAETIAKLDKVLAEFNEWEMAAMERAAYATKSFLIGLALVKGRLTAEQAAQAAHVEVNAQIERWGEVEDCEYLSRPISVV